MGVLTVAAIVIKRHRDNEYKYSLLSPKKLTTSKICIKRKLYIIYRSLFC